MFSISFVPFYFFYVIFNKRSWSIRRVHQNQGPCPLGPYTFLHRLNIYEAKIRSALKKLMIFIL